MLFRSALAFLVFDVELALLWPILPRCLEWLHLGKDTLVFVEVAAFAGTLALGLMWVAAMGGFAWDRNVEDTFGEDAGKDTNDG